ncbi:1814_t:CDS:2 [Scutellospora calospora]|uniref:1814_t:CDS:1 n=1 Tax=Scutellospora calospora TaxID=85575 RepID=A0ACA9LFY7_9GLOM|nr:1814_t:CDS:2 [Scutellospora calospora]
MQYFLENVKRISQTFSRSSSIQVENSSVSSMEVQSDNPPTYEEAIAEPQNSANIENNVSRSEAETQNVSISTDRLSDYIAQNISLHK